MVSAHCDSVAIEAAPIPPGGIPDPPWSTMVPLAARSSAPNCPSVMLKLAVLPVMVAGSAYQLAVGMLGVGLYFQYCAPAGEAGLSASRDPLVKAIAPWIGFAGVDDVLNRLTRCGNTIKRQEAFNRPGLVGDHRFIVQPTQG